MIYFYTLFIIKYLIILRFVILICHYIVQKKQMSDNRVSLSQYTKNKVYGFHLLGEQISFYFYYRIRTHAIKFLEVIVITLSRRNPVSIVLTLYDCVFPPNVLVIYHVVYFFHLIEQYSLFLPSNSFCFFLMASILLKSGMLLSCFYRKIFFV